jgi:V/A-type H+-transporting ATPase subunit A
VIQDGTGKHHDILLQLAGTPFTSVLRRLDLEEPLITGTRILDAFFPVAERHCHRSGRIGTGKTVLSSALARWADIDIIVYELRRRGNEMADAGWSGAS